MLLRHPPPVGVVDVGALGDAQQRIVGREHALVAEEHVVGGDQRQVGRVGELDQRLFDLVLLRRPVPLDLDIEAAREDALQPVERDPRRVRPVLQQMPPHLARHAAGQRQQSLRVRRQVRQRDLWDEPRLGAQERIAGQLHEVAIAGFVLHQQDQLVRWRAHARAFRLVRTRHRHQAAGDRLHAGVLGVGGELHGAEQIAGVRHRHGRHLLAARQLHQLLGLDRAFGQRIGGMDAQVDEIGEGHRMLWSLLSDQSSGPPSSTLRKKRRPPVQGDFFGGRRQGAEESQADRW